MEPFFNLYIFGQNIFLLFNFETKTFFKYLFYQKLFISFLNSKFLWTQIFLGSNFLDTESFWPKNYFWINRIETLIFLFYGILVQSFVRSKICYSGLKRFVHFQLILRIDIRQGWLWLSCQSNQLSRSRWSSSSAPACFTFNHFTWNKFNWNDFTQNNLFQNFDSNLLNMRSSCMGIAMWWARGLGLVW